MCGIAGFVGRGELAWLQAMTHRIAHRGPDADGHYIDAAAGVYLGHRRLAIVDLEGGAQPMWTADGSVGVIFNGEIYNHGLLRDELKAAGCIFQTDHSDTEVLLHAWKIWGEDFVSRLNGMWAFAIYDRTQRCIFMSRDRFGEKPLYWFQRSGTFAFASELTALMEHPDCPRSSAARALQKYYAYAFIPAPLTILEHVSKLPAGHNLRFDLNDDRVTVTRYWHYEIDPIDPAVGEESLVDELLELLDGAVKRRLMSDVPLGVFLSGGVDSSLIAALAAKHIGSGQLKTFSIGFTDASFDELPHANRVAALLGTDHHTDVLDLNKAIELLPGILENLDEPQGDASLLPTWLLARFTRQLVTVALGGDGGDELFAGYDPFLALKKAELYSQMVPRPVHAAIRLLATHLPVSHKNISLDFKIKRTLRGLSYPASQWNPAWIGALEPHEIAEFLRSPCSPEDVYSEAISAWDACAQTNTVDRTLEFFTRFYLQDGILAKVDRATMMNSLEARAPFLDIEVANFARRLPAQWKLRNGTTKYLLKQAALRLLPADIVHRKKKGFGTPVGSWLRTGRLAPTSLDPFVRNRVVAHQAGKVDDRLFLWCQLVRETWCKNHAISS